MLIKDYLRQVDESQTFFAATMGVHPQTVTQWINAKWQIYDGWLVSPRRKIPNYKAVDTYVEIEKL